MKALLEPSQPRGSGSCVLSESAISAKPVVPGQFWSQTALSCGTVRCRLSLGLLQGPFPFSEQSQWGMGGVSVNELLCPALKFAFIWHS